MSNKFNDNSVSPPSDSSDTIAMMLEIIFGMFGMLGLGWLYAGNIPIAIAAFIGFIIVAFIEIAVVAATLGLAACLILPINLAIAVFSGLKARDYVRNTGAHGSIIYVILALILGLILLCGGLMLFAGGLAALGSL